jgi:hypothetical protein
MALVKDNAMNYDDNCVQPISSQEARPWILKKHYAKRMPSVVRAFGLFLDKSLIGVVTYGIPPCAGLSQSKGVGEILELNRLCIDDSAPKNAASVLVGRSLKLLKKPCVVISYADCNQGHVGYIYQATNWIYTGTGGQLKEYELNGKSIHDRSLGHLGITSTKDRDSYILERGGRIIEKVPKHRYVFLCGSKTDKKRMWKALGWNNLPYPKGETHRYDASTEITRQSLLFCS